MNQLEEARTVMERAQRVLEAHETLWDAEWKAAPNPFLAVKSYFSYKSRSKRLPIIQAAQIARECYEQLKPQKGIA